MEIVVGVNTCGILPIILLQLIIHLESIFCFYKRWVLLFSIEAQKKMIELEVEVITWPFQFPHSTELTKNKLVIV